MSATDVVAVMPTGVTPASAPASAPALASVVTNTPASSYAGSSMKCLMAIRPIDPVAHWMTR